MKIKLLLLLCCGLWSSCNSYDYCPVTPSESDLVFTGLARSWDEARPLGNATVGALVWQRDSTPTPVTGQNRFMGFTSGRQSVGR